MPSYLDFPSAVGADALPRALRDAALAELASGETLLWAGQPDPNRSMRGSLGIVLFGIPWTLFSLFWVTMAFGMTWRSSGTPLLFKLFFPLFGLPFVGIGFAMLLSPLGAKKKAQATAYVVTDRRILIITVAGEGKQRSVEAFVPTVGAGMQRTEQTNGRGDLVIPRPYGGTIGMRSRSWTVQPVTTGGNSTTFVGIPDVRAVERLILETFASAPGPGGVGGLPTHLLVKTPIATPSTESTGYRSGPYEPDTTSNTIGGIGR